MPGSTKQKPERLLPRSCECGRLLTRPPTFLRLLEVLAPGRGHGELILSSSGMASMLQITRQRVSVLVRTAKEAGAIDPVDGTNAYKRSWYGRQILGRWKTATKRSKR